MKFRNGLIGLVMGFGVAYSGACDSDSSQPTTSCVTDYDCKGDRVCENGVCSGGSSGNEGNSQQITSLCEHVCSEGTCRDNFFGWKKYEDKCRNYCPDLVKECSAGVLSKLKECAEIPSTAHDYYCDLDESNIRTCFDKIDNSCLITPEELCGGRCP